MNRPPVGTYAILLIYAVVFASFGLHESDNAQLSKNLMLAGAVTPASVGCGEYWRLIGAAFAHVGLMHLLFNAYFLFHVGPVVERELGLGRFLILYLVTAIGGNVLICLLYHPQLPAAGGSTALFGLMGALVALLLRRQRRYGDFFQSGPARSVVFMILANLALGWLIPQISNTGHIGGLIAGLILGQFIFKVPDAGGRPLPPPLLPRIAAILLLVTFTTTACFPFPRLWYQARNYWLAEDDASPPMVAVLEGRGVNRPTLAYLDGMRRFRDGFGNSADLEQLVKLRRENGNEILTQLVSFGVAPQPGNFLFKDFFEAIREGEQDPGRLLPEDLWQEP